MKETDVSIEIHIDHDSRIPKYRQIVNSILSDIESGNLIVGQRVPSINEISEEYDLSRDTVEKAYHVLKAKQIIVSAKGKGYYVAKNVVPSKLRILFMMNKLSSYKLSIYNSFIKAAGNNAQVDLTIYHCDPKIFSQSLRENLGAYDHYVIMPHFKDDLQAHQSVNDEVMELLKKIPDDKLLLLDNYIPELKRNVAAVYQDFKMDLYGALHEGLDVVRRYTKLILVYPRRSIYPYPVEIRNGFQKFCVDFSFSFEILDEIDEDMELRANDAYVVIEESDLVSLVKQVRESPLRLGQDIGIISYNDTPLKELLGITVVSTDFQTMGESAAYMIFKKKKELVKNVFHFINRNSA